MIVAIAGSGDMARYASEEYVRSGHEVIILSRSLKPNFDRPGVRQVVTDYSVPSLLDALNQCKAQALVSLILDYSQVFVEVHQNMISACQQSSTCKRFVPSEFAGNVEDFPKQPSFYYRTREPIRELLRNQHQLEWTLVCCGWLMDFAVPARNRYLKEVGEAFPVDLAGNRVVIPGTGEEPVSFVSARDLARAMGALLHAPASSWKQYTYICGDQTTFNELTHIMLRRQPDLKVSYKSFAQLTEILQKSNDEEARLLAEYQLGTIGEALYLPVDRVKADKERYFQGVQFRSIENLLAEVDKDLNLVV